MNYIAMTSKIDAIVKYLDFPQLTTDLTINLRRRNRVLKIV
jgi:hypothetical protein